MRGGGEETVFSHMIRDIQEDGQAGEARTDAVSYEHAAAAWIFLDVLFFPFPRFVDQLTERLVSK